MKRWIVGLLIFGWAAAVVELAVADYRSSPSSDRKKSGEADSFDQVVDLKKFRRGNYEWDTQELIKSGLTALHGEHLQILSEIRELRAEVSDMKGQYSREKR